MTSPAPYLFTPPPMFTLPFSEGGDCSFNFIYKPLLVDGSGNPILDSNGNQQFVVADYPSGSTVALGIDTTPTASTFDGTVDASVATFTVPQTTADTITARLKWRVVITYSGGGKLVMCNGLTARKDGDR